MNSKERYSTSYSGIGLRDIYHSSRNLQKVRRLLIQFLLKIVDNGFFGFKPLKTHIIVCGFPRGGTTLTQVILEVCMSGVKCFGKELDAISAAQLSFRNQPIMITKRPSDIFSIDDIRAYYSRRKAKPKFIVLIRDPRSVLTSFHYSRSNYYVSVQRWRSIYSKFKLIKDFPDVFVLRYENLVTNIDLIQAVLSNFLESDFIHTFSDFYKHVPESLKYSALNGVRPIDPSTILKWKDTRHHRRIKELLTNEMPELCERLIELNYEENDGWAKQYLR